MLLNAAAGSSDVLVLSLALSERLKPISRRSMSGVRDYGEMAGSPSLCFSLHYSLLPIFEDNDSSWLSVDAVLTLIPQVTRGGRMQLVSPLCFLLHSRDIAETQIPGMLNMREAFVGSLPFI